MKTIHTVAARELISVAEIILTVVGATYGPRGRTVALQKPIGPVVITKDGITVAKGVRFDEPLHQAIYDVLLSSAKATSSATGDGTTTTFILAAALLREAVQLVHAGWHSRLVAEKLRKFGAEVVSHLKAQSEDVVDPNVLYQVALNAANRDAGAAYLTVEALKRAGAKGSVKLVDTHGTKSQVSSVPGFSVACKPIAGKVPKALEHVGIFLCDYTLDSFADIQGVLEYTAEKQWPHVLMVEELTGQALEAVRLNKEVPLYVLKAPLFDYRLREMLEDYRVMFNAPSVYSAFRGCPIDKSLLIPGYAEKVLIEAKKVTFEVPDGVRDTGHFHLRINQLENALACATMDLDREWIRDRMACMAGSVATIQLGGFTELEKKELRDRLEDSIMASRRAIESGVNKGCGLALAEGAMATSDDPLFGKFYRAFQEPERMLLRDRPDFQDDIKTVDPTAVLVAAVENAVSAVATLINVSTFLTK